MSSHLLVLPEGPIASDIRYLRQYLSADSRAGPWHDPNIPCVLESAAAVKPKDATVGVDARDPRTMNCRMKRYTLSKQTWNLNKGGLWTILFFFRGLLFRFHACLPTLLSMILAYGIPNSLGRGTAQPCAGDACLT